MDKKAIMEGIVIGVGVAVLSQLILALIIPVLPENGFIITK